MSRYSDLKLEERKRCYRQKYDEQFPLKTNMESLKNNSSENLFKLKSPRNEKTTGLVKQNFGDANPTGTLKSIRL